MKNIFLLAITVLLSSCSTMYFDNGSPSSSMEASQWHHVGILRLVEFSSPVQTSKVCSEGDWQSIKVEKPFVHGLVTSISYGLYDPWNVEHSCK